MIVDTSAAVAILRSEPDAEALLVALESAPAAFMSAASVLELAMVTASSGRDVPDEFIATFGIRILAVDAEHLAWARRAHERYGRGSGSPARLNFGDCFVYAAAKVTGEPLLFKGDDFTHTDVETALT